jgi:hypothetical protein
MPVNAVNHIGCSPAPPPLASESLGDRTNNNKKNGPVETGPFCTAFEHDTGKT